MKEFFEFAQHMALFYLGLCAISAAVLIFGLAMAARNFGKILEFVTTEPRKALWLAFGGLFVVLLPIGAFTGGTGWLGEVIPALGAVMLLFFREHPPEGKPEEPVERIERVPTIEMPAYYSNRLPAPARRGGKKKRTSY